MKFKGILIKECSIINIIVVHMFQNQQVVQVSAIQGLKLHINICTCNVLIDHKDANRNNNQNTRLVHTVPTQSLVPCPHGHRVPALERSRMYIQTLHSPSSFAYRPATLLQQ